MKALVITVPDGFKTAVVTVTYEGAEGKIDLETKSTRGKDTNWALDFSDAGATEKSNKGTFMECNDCAINPYCLVDVDGFCLKEAMQKKSAEEEEET
ncbi:hypothetical protein [Eubacterium sp. 1001713B170207_170306_E7]|uniref:hypothetical protein n=1 Tax=Eubacterium sp. 1001713B170207_170306_E7 TaxID=2787097 RepID=UPI00189C19F5|nr:hypothetical protein [Eubacterium sp. 1001713B170207_170306_E7]